MRRLIASAIEQDAAKLVRRHQEYARGLHDDIERKKRRTGVAHTKLLLTPSYWNCAPGFNPYHVRAQNRPAKIAAAMANALDGNEYVPRPAVVHDIPKSSGGTRTVSIFQVADSALSRVMYQSLTTKNSTRLNPRCYAYRYDVNRHDAVFHVASELKSDLRTFVAEFDFRKYFDTISHEHLERILRDGRFLVTHRELAVIRAFLRAPAVPESTYSTGGPPRTRGIPQGTSVSLFLANVAAFPLDRALERLGVGFARFADDTLIWSNNYGELCRAVDALCEAARLMGVEINLDKSDGISILAAAKETAEFRHKTHVNFLGCAIGRGTISLKDVAVARTKKELSFIVYQNLLQPLVNGHVVPDRFAPPVDRDYVTMVFQLRRYLYGDLTESKLRRFLTRAVPVMRFKGMLSSYPLVDDWKQLSSLDGWLQHTVYRALRRRAALLAVHGHSVLPVPHGLTAEELLRFRTTTSGGAPLDLRLPSFRRMTALLRRATSVYGTSAITNAQSHFYYSN